MKAGMKAATDVAKEGSAMESTAGASSASTPVAADVAVEAKGVKRLGPFFKYIPCLKQPKVEVEDSETPGLKP